MKKHIIPTITEKQIQSRVGEKSFEKSLRYYSNDAIHATRQADRTLKADCYGSGAASYRVEVTFDSNKIATASCSCPVGSGGCCKHVAALLLTWKNKPKQFTVIQNTNDALSKKSKQELIGIIKYLVEQEPDLELILESFTSTKEHDTVDSNVYQRQAEKVFQDSFKQWRGEMDMANKLLSIKHRGDQFVKEKDFENAWAVYHGVSQEIIRNMIEYGYQDEDGYVFDVVNECVTGMKPCLKNETDNDVREKLLESLFSIMKTDIKMGGIDFGHDALDVICSYSLSDEKKMIVQWAEKSLPKKRSWEKEEYERVVVKLSK